MPKLIDLTGKRFGRLTVIEQLPERKNRRVIWKCRCDCGNEIDVAGDYLKSGDTKSCGCLKKDIEQKNLREEYDNHRVDNVNASLLEAKRRKDNKSGVKGVCHHKPTGKWDAYISVNGKRKFLGRFSNKQDAIAVRSEAEKKYHRPILDKKETQGGRTMHPIDQLLQEYRFNRNQFSKLSGIKPSSIGNYVTRNTPVGNIRVEVIIKLSEVLEITTDEVIKKLFEYEERGEGE